MTGEQRTTTVFHGLPSYRLRHQAGRDQRDPSDHGQAAVAPGGHDRRDSRHQHSCQAKRVRAAPAAERDTARTLGPVTYFDD